MVLERCSTYTCYVHFACASFFGIFTSVLFIDIRHVHMVSIKSMHSQFIIYTTYYKTRFMHKYLVALIWCSKLYTTKWLKKYAQSFPAWGKVVQIAQTCYTRRIAVLLEPPFRLCQNSAVPTGRDLVTFNRTERQRYAAILEIAKVSTQNPCRAMPCRAMQSSLKSIGHLPGTDRTRMPWNGCARTWAAVSQWPGSETLVMCQLWQLHICVAYFTVTNHQHPSTRAANRNFLKYKRFGYQPYHDFPRHQSAFFHSEKDNMEIGVTV